MSARGKGRFWIRLSVKTCSWHTWENSHENLVGQGEGKISIVRRLLPRLLQNERI